MGTLGRVLAVPYPVKPMCLHAPRNSHHPCSKFIHGCRKFNSKWRSMASEPDSSASSSSFSPSFDSDSSDTNATGYHFFHSVSLFLLVNYNMCMLLY